MSDIDDFGSDGGSDRSRRHDFGSEEESDSYDTRRKRYSDDDDEEDDEEDDNDDELRRDGFVVDDDDVEENQSDDSAERRRRRKKKKKKRRHHHSHTEDGYDDDMLDEEDLALVAENTNQSYASAPSAGAKFKRLKRGRARHTLDDGDDDDDAGDKGSDREATRGRDYGRVVDDEDDGFIEDDVDDLGLFDSGRGRGAGDGFEEDDGFDERPAASQRRYDDDIQAPRRSRAPPTAHGEGFVDSLDGIDEDTWAELQDIFGTGDEYAFAMEAAQADDVYRERTLAEVFEPAELEAKLMTQRDEEIRSTDIPERMQVQAAGGAALRSLSEDEIEEETTWIVRQLHAWLSKRAAGGLGEGDDDETPFAKADFINERFLAAVLSVLKLLSQDFCEVPYIAQHRREVFVTPAAAAGGEGEEPEMCQWLTVGDMWRLHDYDRQFRGLLAARRVAERQIERLAGMQRLGGDDERYARELLGSASSVEEIGDVAEWLQAQHASAMHAWAQAQRSDTAPRRAARTAGAWEQAVQAGVDRFVHAAGLSARQLGDNIGRPGSHVPSPSAETPDDVSRVLVGSGSSPFATVDLASRAGRAAMAQMIALDPQIRRFVRAYCAEHAGVVVRPTERGVREIVDEEHPAFAFKFLRNKPLAAFVGSAQWLAVDRAERGGLVRVAFSLCDDTAFDARDADTDVFAADRERSARVVAALLEPHVLGDSADGAKAAWDAVRRQAVLDAVRDHVLPMVWRETAQRLLAQAFDVVADACRASLQRRIDVQPPRTARMAEGSVPCVAVVGGGGFEASSRGALRVVVVDEDGLVREQFSADSLRAGDQAEGDGVQPLLAALASHSVDVVAVAGMSLQTRRLFDDVNALVTARGVDVMVTYADDEVARLWWDSAEAQAELPLLRREERYCVAVARTLQDAGCAYASLGSRVLSLPLHAQQADLDQAALLPVVERAFVNVVNRTGVDVNHAAQHAHRAHVLQYVAGLGPRKAQALVSRITGDNALETRSELITRSLCARRTFINCAAFLRVRPAVEVLDATLVHPEDYDLARKMALDALDIEEEDDDNNAYAQRGRKRSDAPSRYVAELMRRAPEKLDELDLGKYADELKRLLDVYKLETLRFIRRQLQHPDRDARREFAPPDPAAVLHMLTGETLGESLREDGSTVVAATVVRVQPRFAIARLDSGLEGFISIANVCDERIDEVSDALAPGQAVVGVVKRIDLEKLALDLSLRSSDVSAACARARQPVPDASAVDKHFDLDAEARVRARAKAQQRTQTARMRTIPHPLFKPLSAREAEQYLAARPPGDCVIRPSSRGVDHIAVTWKVAEGLCQHIDVREEGKPSDVALGHSFYVGDSVFSELDELVAFHIEPIVHKLDEVRRSAKYYDPERDPLYAAEPAASLLGPNDYSDDYRRRRQELWDARTTRHLDALAQSTGRGAYCITLSLSKPGALTLAFKPTPSYRGLMKWTARVEPNEYRLGDRGRYPDINGLIVGFKTMQTNPSAGREQSRRGDAYAAGQASRDSGRRDRDRREPYGAQAQSSQGARWADSYRGGERERERERDRERDRERERDRDRDRDRGQGNRERDYGRASRHGHSGAAGWDTGPSSTHHSSGQAASSSGWDM